MNKLEYLNQLETILKKSHMSKADIDDIIRDYAEFFEEGRRQGESDGEIAAKLGAPDLIAQQILEENNASNSNTAAATKTEFKLPDISLPKIKLPKLHLPKWKRQEKEPTCEKKLKHKEKSIFSSVLGCLGSVITFATKMCLLLFVGGSLAAIFAGLCVGFVGVLAALIAGFIAVLAIYCAATVVTHFFTFPVTLLAIFSCIALLAFIICLAALLTMLLIWCGKLFIKILHALLIWPQKSQPLAESVPPPTIALPVQEKITEEQEETFYE